MKYRRQNQREQADHADDWLMTYADMITLLLCFFAIFFSVSIPRKDVQPKTEMPQPVQEQPLTQPVVPPNILEGNLPFHEADDMDQTTETVDTVTPPAPPISTLVDPPPTVLPPPASVPEIVDHFTSQLPADVDQKGDRITTLAMSSAAFFDSGSATLSGAGKTILHDVALHIQSDKFKDYQITVEGHTDDTPIQTLQFPSNWELSTARASAVVHFFIDQGVQAQRLRAAGYADTFPLAPNRNNVGKPIPENQARNRRVVIKLEKIDKGQ